MKNVTTAIIIFISIFFVSNTSLFGQLTLHLSDLSYEYTFGNKVYTYWDKTTKSVNIGNKNSSSWDFSGLVNDEQYVSHVVSPDSTPFRPDYPHADWAFVFDVPQTNDHDYEFYCHSSSVHLHGLVYTNPSNPGHVDKIAYHPVKIFAYMPMTYFTSWKDTVVGTETVMQDNNVISSVSDTIITSALVDAYGPLTFPGGRTVDALRARIEEVTIKNNTAVKSLKFQWYAKSGEIVVIKTDTTSADHGMINVTDNIKWITTSQPTAVTEQTPLPLKYGLEQNYPNPFNPSTLINYSLAEDSHVEIQIFSVIGKEVTTLVNESKPAGNYTASFNGSGLASGVYFVKMTASGRTAGFNKIIKMTLLK